jgi:hypothetical protein
LFGCLSQSGEAHGADGGNCDQDAEEHSALCKDRQAHQADGDHCDEDTLYHSGYSQVQLSGTRRRGSNVRAKKEFNRGSFQADFCTIDGLQVSEALGLPTSVTELPTMAV